MLLIDPEYAEAWHGLGLLYLDSGQYDKAIQACRELLCIDSEDPKAWHNLGLAYSDLDQHEPAIQAYREALRIYQEDASSRNNLGISRTGFKLYEQAVYALREALRIRPGMLMLPGITWELLTDGLKQQAILAYQQEMLRVQPAI